MGSGLVEFFRIDYQNIVDILKQLSIKFRLISTNTKQIEVGLKQEPALNFLAYNSHHEPQKFHS